MNTQISDAASRFVTDRHLATLSTIAKDGAIHTVPVGFTLSDGVVRIISSDGTQKVRNIERDARATVGQVDGREWISFVGTATIDRDPAAVRHAEELYAVRYRTPQPNPRRIVIRITVDRVLGSSGMRVE